MIVLRNRWEKLVNTSNILAVLKESCWILFHTAQVTLYSATNPSRVPLNFVRPMISPTLLVIWYSSQSDFLFVLNKHLSPQIRIYLTKKDIFCEENLKELSVTNIVKHRLMPHSWWASLCLLTKMNSLNKSFPSFNLPEQLFLCQQRWFGEKTPPIHHLCFAIFFPISTGDK